MVKLLMDKEDSSMKKLIVVFISVLLFLLVSYFALCPRIVLKSGDMVLELGDSYQELGYRANNLFSDFTNDVKVDTSINNNKIGTYQVNYRINYLFYDIKVTRKVKVVDNEAPEIILTGEKEVNVCPGQEYIEEGYQAIDNYDLDITSKVSVTNFDDRVIYEVVDSSLNKSIVERVIHYQDNVAPVINLKGNSEMVIYTGYQYLEPGYEAIDNCDLDISNKVEIVGSVDNYHIGSYTLTYKVDDEAGNHAEVKRIVRVINKPSYYGDGKIYLTFDDGPSGDITPQVLDILKEEGIKATFFVLNKPSSLDYLIKRAYDEGHTIALHGATHEYSYIYANRDNFFSDLKIISDKVKNITGVESKIIRFPGGSSNTISRHYAYGIMTRLTQEVSSLGYHYFDWNVDCNDAGGAKNSSEVYYNVVNNLSHAKTNVVLMHDFSGNYKTLNALRDIIRFGKENGYTFSNITMDTPQVVHGVNN